MRFLASITSILALVGTVGLSQPASAASLLSITGGSDLAVPATNDLVPTPNPAFQALVPLGGVIADTDGSGLFWDQGAQLSTTADNVTLSFNYIGSFGSATNTFSAGGGSFTTLGLDETVGGDFTAQPGFDLVQALPGLIDFSFASTFDNGSVSNITGNNPAGSGQINYLAAYLELVEGGGGGVLWELSDTPTNVVLLLLDDAGAGPDSDYDDLGVVVVATPIPAAFPLFGTALVGFGIMGWQRRKTRQA